jgi:hypothetical protein
MQLAIHKEPMVGTKMRSSDRQIVLRPIEGKSSLSSTKLIDNRLFTGDNTLHAKLDPQTMLWYMEYDKGGVPQPLKQRFTSFLKLMQSVREYFRSRNIEVVEVID